MGVGEREIVGESESAFAFLTHFRDRATGHIYTEVRCKVLNNNENRLLELYPQEDITYDFHPKIPAVLDIHRSGYGLRIAD